MTELRADSSAGNSREQTIAIPSKEAVEYGRSVIEREVARLRQGEANYTAKGDAEKAARWWFAAYWLERTLGHGCVIGPFDARYLDDEWRAWYSGVLDA